VISGDTVWLYRPHAIGNLPAHVRKIHIFHRGPYELIRRIHGNIYELASTHSGALVTADSSQFIVRAKSAPHYNLGPIKHYTQKLFKSSSVVLYRETRKVWYLVVIIADIGAESVMIHYLNVNPKDHGGKRGVKSVRSVPLSERKFAPVWIKGNDTNDEVYNKEQPEDRNAYDDCVLRNTLVVALQDKISLTDDGRLSEASMVSMKVYNKSSATFDITYSST
jgi:hypothetical protein